MNNSDIDISESLLTWRKVFKDKNCPQYAEFGKIFHDYGATDWQILDYSDTEFRKYGEILFREEFGFQNRLLNDNLSGDAFSNRRVGVAFKDSYLLQGFVFVQFQQKKEGEYSNNPRTNRPFIQARFSYITSEMIVELYKRRLALFSSLLIDAHSQKDDKNKIAISSDTQYIWTLRDYRETDNSGRPSTNSVTLSFLRPVQAANTQLVKGIIAVLLKNFYFSSANNILALHPPQKIVVVAPDLSIHEKLQIFDIVQYYVYPVLGIISFSFDAIVDQDVMLRFYSESAEKDAYTLDKLNNIVVGNNLADYYEVASQLDSSVLYHEDFRKHFLSGKTARQASRRLFLDLKEFSSYDIDDWIFDVSEFLDEIEFNKTERDFLYDRLDKTSLQNILSYEKTPLKLISSLLNYLREKKSGDLLAYMIFHLSVPADKRTDPLLENRLSEYLNDVIGKCESNCLLDIPGPDRKQYYCELMVYAHDARFLPKADLGETVLLSLLFLPGDDLFYSIKTVLDVAPNKPFLDDIVFQLNNYIFNWSAMQVLDLWNSVNLKSHSLYSALLNQFLGFDKNVELIISTPDLLKKILYSGRELNRYYLDLPQMLVGNNANSRSDVLDYQSTELVVRDIQVLPKLEMNLSDHLRKVIYRISEIHKNENTKLIEWWIFAELGYADFEIIHNDLSQLQKMVFNSEFDLQTNFIPEFKYIVSFGQSNSQLSLHKACKNCNGDIEALLDSVNHRLLKALTEIWVEAEVSLNVVDLKLFVDQLPFPNKLLAKIAKSESQKKTIFSLDSLSALKWLEMTSDAGLRNDYLYNDKDSLCRLFVDFPSPSSNLAWRMLAVEEFILFEIQNWSDYVSMCEVWKKRLHKVVLSKDVEIFLDIVLKTDVNFDDKFTKRKIINLFVNKIVRGDVPEIIDFTESIVVGLGAYSRITDMSNLAQKIKSCATEFLIYFLNDLNSPDKIKVMTQAAQTEMRTFVEKEKKFIFGISSYIFAPQLEIGKSESKAQNENSEFESQKDVDLNIKKYGPEITVSANKKITSFDAEWVENTSLSNQIRPQKRISNSKGVISDGENDINQINTSYFLERNDYVLWARRLLPIIVPVALLALIVICAILLSLFSVFDVFKWLYFYFN